LWHNKKMKNKVVLGVLSLAVIGGIVWFAKGGAGELGGSPLVKYAEATDAADDFYHKWLLAMQDASAQPDLAALAQSSVLTKDLSAKISSALQSDASPDPVLCQISAAQGISLRNVFVQSDKAEVLVTSKDKKVLNQAVVSLTKKDDTWVISDIKCTNGDVAPEKEFSFDKEGFLLKNSIPKPYNSQNWHLVFADNGVAGNVVPLIFDAKSQCVSLDGKSAICKPELFKETAKARVWGGMTERGATVVKLELIK
jgi:hypothetical protein